MSKSEPVTFYNRHTGELEQEAIYGEGFLRFAYGNPLGSLALWGFVKRAWFSRWYGWRMRRRGSAKKVRPFVKEFGLDPEEFVTPMRKFEHFDAFFTRKLRDGARPIEPDPQSLTFPADGRHLVIGDLSISEGMWAKGQRFDLARFLGSPERAARYDGGAALMSRLCPTDYHRYHFPCAGEAGAPELINGVLNSVNPIALRRRVAYLWENKRVLTEIDAGPLGLVTMIEIGATCVGGIVQTYTPGGVAKGDEKGYFHFGGSMTVLLFEPGRVAIDADLLEYGGQGIEVYARMGERFGEVVE
jgi:phosphatidylserine decarboxylase